MGRFVWKPLAKVMGRFVLKLLAKVMGRFVWKPLAKVMGRFVWKPLANVMGRFVWKPLAKLMGRFVWKPLAKLMGRLIWKPLAKASLDFVSRAGVFAFFMKTNWLVLLNTALSRAGRTYLQALRMTRASVLSFPLHGPRSRVIFHCFFFAYQDSRSRVPN